MYHVKSILWGGPSRDLQVAQHLNFEADQGYELDRIIVVATDSNHYVMIITKQK